MWIKIDKGTFQRDKDGSKFKITIYWHQQLFEELVIFAFTLGFNFSLNLY